MTGFQIETPSLFFLFTVPLKSSKTHQTDKHLSAVGHHDKVRVVVAESVQTERIPSAGGIAVPPAHTVNAGQCHCHVVLEIIVQLTFLLVQALGQGGSLAGQGDKRCQLEPGFGDDLAYLKPVIYIWYTL